MKTFEEFTEKSKYNRYDYLIYKLFWLKDMQSLLSIIRLTEIPTGYIDFYSFIPLAKLKDGVLIDINSNDNLSIIQGVFEPNVLYSSRDLKSVKKEIYLLDNIDKYNL